MDSCDNFVASQSYAISNTMVESISYDRIALALLQMLHIWLTIYGCSYMAMLYIWLSWKPRLHNSKSHIKETVLTRILTQFIDECCDGEIHFKYLAFVIVDMVNNTSGLTCNQIEDL